MYKWTKFWSYNRKTYHDFQAGTLISLSIRIRSTNLCANSTWVNKYILSTEIAAPKINFSYAGCFPIGGPRPQETPLAVWDADGEPAQWRGRLIQGCQVCAGVHMPLHCVGGFCIRAAVAAWADVRSADVRQLPNNPSCPSTPVCLCLWQSAVCASGRSGPAAVEGFWTVAQATGLPGAQTHPGV